MPVETIVVLVKSVVIALIVGSIARLLTIIDRRALGIQSFRSVFQGNLTLFAEVTKFIFKERIFKGLFFTISPAVVLLLSFIPVVSVPFAGKVTVLEGITIHPEILTVSYGSIIAILAISIYSYFCAFIGFVAKDGKNSLNSYRTISHVFSDDMLLVIALIGVIFVYRSFSMHQIVLEQEAMLWASLPSWGVFTQPLGAIIFLFAIVMKSDRAPFNYSSTRGEIGPGFESLFTSASFVVVRMSKSIFTVVGAMVFVTLFLGGYSMLPGLDFFEVDDLRAIAGLELASFIFKTIVTLVLLACIKSIRLQYERSVYLNWIVLMPLGLLNILITVLYTYYMGKI